MTHSSLTSVVVCVCLPAVHLQVRDLSESLDVFHDVFRVYPLWLCPMRIPRNPSFAKYGGFVRPLPDGDEMFVDVGAYGNPQLEGFNARQACRKVRCCWRSSWGGQGVHGGSSSV
jgi:Delta24-sterol reductase